MEDKAVQRNTLSAEKIVIMLGFYSKTERNLLQIVGFVLIYLFSLQISLSSPYEIHTIMEEKMQNESVYIYIPQTGVNDLAIAAYKIIMYGSKNFGPVKDKLKVHFVETEEEYLFNQIVGITTRDGKYWAVVGSMDNIQSFIEHYYGVTPPNKHEYHRFLTNCIKDANNDFMDAIDLGSELEDKEMDELSEANNYPISSYYELTTKDLDCGFLLRELISKHMMINKDDEAIVGYCKMLIDLKIDDEKVLNYLNSA